VGRVDYDSGASSLTHYVLAGAADGNITGLTPDPKVFWFKNAAGAGRLLVAETYYPSTTDPAQPSEFSVFDADTLAQKWPQAGGAGWDVSIVNVYNIVTLTVGGDQYIYGVDYDSHKLFRVKAGVDGKGEETYTYDSSTSFTYVGPSNFSFGVDVATDGTSIYALFTNSETSYAGPYSASAVVKLPPSLSPNPVDHVLAAPNAVSIKLWKDNSNSPSVDYIYIPAIGGPQNYGGYNSGSVVQRIRADFLGELQTLLINAPIPDPTTPPTPGGEDTTDYYDIAFAPEGTASSKVFILKGSYNSAGSQFTWRLFQTDMGTINAAPSGGSLISAVVTASDHKATASVPGYVWALYYNTADDNVWFVRGNEIVIYDYDEGEGLFKVAGPIEMGGTPADNLAPDGFNINGAAIYGVVGTVKGAPSPSRVSARAAAAEEGEEEK
jgi:hypothetical protein